MRVMAAPRKYSVDLQARATRIAAGARKDPRVLGYGRWEHFEPEDSDNHYVNLWVDHASSVTTTR